MKKEPPLLLLPFPLTTQNQNTILRMEQRWKRSRRLGLVYVVAP